MAIRKKQGNGKEVAASEFRTTSSATAESYLSEATTRKKTIPKKVADSCCASDMQISRCSASKTIDNNAIAHRAWEIWQREGCPEGRALEHWLQAERELSGN